MKNRILPLALFLIFSGSLMAQTAQQDLLRLYSTSETDEGRLAILKRMQGEKMSLEEEFSLSALQDLLVRQVDRGTPESLTVKNQIALILLGGLGEKPSLAAAPSLWTLYEEAQDPVLRGKALVAYLATGAENALGKVIRVLFRLNQSEVKTRSEETLAWYAVSALEKSRSAEAFEPLFSAARSWYSSQSQVKEKAAEALGKLEGDYTEGLANIIIWSLDFKLKKEAAEYLAAGDFTPEQKVRGAKTALEQGLKWQPGNEEDILNLYRLRAAALGILKKEKNRDEEAAALVSRAFTAARDREEQLLCLQTLGVNGSNKAVETLGNLLQNLNARNTTSGLKDGEIVLVRQTIAALGATKNPAARTSLMEVEFSNYPPVILREAQAALGSLP